MCTFFVDPDIRKAHTLDSSFYTEDQYFEYMMSGPLRDCWHFAGDTFQFENKNCIPFKLQDEELALVKNGDGNIKCLSNICTHRGNILIKEPSNLNRISCSYHGRCFDLNGRFLSMPEFREVADFPSQEDHLKALEIQQLGPFLFTNLSDQKQNYRDWMRPILERMSWFPYERLRAVNSLDVDYPLNAHWALYCDNYLEGFHVPFVHEQLNNTIDYGSYTTEAIENTVLQIGYAKEGEPHFNHLHGYPKSDKAYAYYWFLFPNLMINYYSWGISINIVQPISKKECLVRFKTYLFDHATESDFHGTHMHNTQMEDEEVVLDVQRGMESKFYKQGRFSPRMEVGVHHFHRLLAKCFENIDS